MAVNSLAMRSVAQGMRYSRCWRIVCFWILNLLVYICIGGFVGKLALPFFFIVHM